MKKLLLIALLSILAATPALADRGYHRGGHGGGWGWRGAWIVPAVIGGAIIYDVTRPRTIFVEPAPVYIQSAPVYVQPVPGVTSLQQPWYFCPGANAYYPYVSVCPTGWQVVPSTPPGPVVSQPSNVPPPGPVAGSAPNYPPPMPPPPPGR